MLAQLIAELEESIDITLSWLYGHPLEVFGILAGASVGIALGAAFLDYLFGPNGPCHDPYRNRDEI